MANTDLSSETIRLIRSLFSENEQQEVIQLIAEQCGTNLPFLENATPRELERVRFAALKLSDSNVDKLRAAIQLGKEDWRDLLVSAGFASDIEAHQKWLKLRPLSVEKQPLA